MDESPSGCSLTIWTVVEARRRPDLDGRELLGGVDIRTTGWQHRAPANSGRGQGSAGARCPFLNLRAIKTSSPRREVATSEQPGRHERKTVDGVL